MRLLGDVHRDHLTLVRDELAEIRRLSLDMDKRRAEMRQPVPQHLPLPHSDSPNGASHAADFSSQSKTPRGPIRKPFPKSSASAGKLGRECQSRWRKLLTPLIQS